VVGWVERRSCLNFKSEHCWSSIFDFAYTGITITPSDFHLRTQSSAPAPEVCQWIQGRSRLQNEGLWFSMEVQCRWFPQISEPSFTSRAFWTLQHCSVTPYTKKLKLCYLGREYQLGNAAKNAGDPPLSTVGFVCNLYWYCTGMQGPFIPHCAAHSHWTNWKQYVKNNYCKMTLIAVSSEIWVVNPVESDRVRAALLGMQAQYQAYNTSDLWWFD
jgi:hypothetical protein